MVPPGELIQEGAVCEEPMAPWMSVFTVSVPMQWAWGSRVETLKSEISCECGARGVSTGLGLLGDNSLPSALAAPASLRPHRPRPLDPGDLLSWLGWDGGVLAWGLDGGTEGGVKIGV